MAYRVHLDYASTSPLTDSARHEMIKAIGEPIFDARRLYDPAIEVRYKIEEYRAKIADYFNCDPFEIIFTSSHSESLATFAYGALDIYESKFRTSAGLDTNINVITSPYDSEIIFKTWLRENVNLRVPRGNPNGTTDINEIKNLIDENTCAISIPYAHPDTGTLQDVAGISEIASAKNSNTIVHVDVRLACPNKRIDFHDLGIGAMSIDPVVFGGPTGVSALILSRRYHLNPLLVGSTQERARRAGIENTIGIAGLAGALDYLKENIDQIEEGNFRIKQRISKALLDYGALLVPETSSENESTSYICSAYFPGVIASAVVAEFNRHGINIHAGSSCGSEEFEPSKQLTAVTQDGDIAESTFRISWGWATPNEDIDKFMSALEKIPFSKK